MWIHDGDMSLHLLDFDEPVEATFEEDFMDARYPFRLCEHKCKRGLEVCRESREYIGLEVGRSEAGGRVVHDDAIMFLIKVIAHTCITTLPEERRKIIDACSLDAY